MCERGASKMLTKVLILLLGISMTASQVVKPCLLTDLGCIRRVLALNSRCNPYVVGGIPSQYTVQQYTFHTPYFNSTFIDYNLVIRNHNKCVVSEFFLNFGTQTVVLALDCPKLSFASNRLQIKHTSKQEDTYYNYSINGTYPLIRLTTNLRYVNGLFLCSSFTFADVTALPQYTINPYDPTLPIPPLNINLLNIFERECFFWRAPLLARYFINSLICNFGCNY